MSVNTEPMTIEVRTLSDAEMRLIGRFPSMRGVTECYVNMSPVTFNSPKAPLLGLVQLLLRWMDTLIHVNLEQVKRPINKRRRTTQQVAIELEVEH